MTDPNPTPEAPEGGGTAAAVVEGAQQASPPPEGPPPSGAASDAAAAAAEQQHADNAQAALEGDEAAFDALPKRWQDEVKKLREEAAGYRTKAKRYEEPLSTLEDHEVDWLLSVAKDLGTPEKQADAARRLKAAADALLDGVPDPEPSADDEPLTLAKLQQIEQERAAKAREEAEVQAVINEAKELGYESGSPDFALLMWLAANAEKDEHKGDLKVAHKRIVDGRQAIIDGWVEEQRRKGASFVTVAGGGGAPGTASDRPKTISEASERARARAEAAKRAAAGAR